MVQSGSGTKWISCSGMKPTREPARINRIQGSQLEIRKEQRSPRISDGDAMIPIISAHYGFAAAGSPAAFPRSRRIQQIQEPAADVPSPTGFGYGQGLHEKNHVRIEPAGGGADGGAHAAIRVDGLDAVKRTGMSDTNVGQQPGDKSFVINAIGLSHGPERVSGQFRVPCGIVSSHGLDSRTHTHADWNHASNDGTGKGKSNERNKA